MVRASSSKDCNFVHDSAELPVSSLKWKKNQRNYVSSVKEYEQAARMEPNAQNMLNWGAELLLHQTLHACH